MITVAASPGRVRADIEDDHGEYHPYTIEKINPGMDDLCFRVIRLDAVKDGDYRTARNHEGKWRCNCADSIYRGRRRACKHVKHVSELWPIVETLKPVQVAINLLPGVPVVNKSESIVNLAKALVAAQGELKNPPLDEKNPHFKSRYTSLAAMRDSIVPTFARHGLALIQSVGSGQRGPCITTLILHTSGEWIETDALEVPASKQDAQGYGSAITYGRRFCLSSVANVVGDDDDDANAASRPAATQQAKPAQQQLPVNGSVSVAMIREFNSLCERLGVHPTEAATKLKHNYGKANFAELAPVQADEVLAQLREKAKALPAKQTA